jgi:hypothetical protein
MEAPIFGGGLRVVDICQALPDERPDTFHNLSIIGLVCCGYGITYGIGKIMSPMPEAGINVPL